MNRNDDAINFDTQNFIGWGKNLLVWSTTKKNQKNIAHYNIYETIWMKLIQHDDDLCTEFGDLLDDERRWMWQHTRASIIFSDFCFKLHLSFWSQFISTIIKSNQYERNTDWVNLQKDI